MSTQPRRLAVVGLGKVAKDQHLPAIEQVSAFDLVATVSSSGGLDGVPNFAKLPDLLTSDLAVDTVALCVPPAPRFALARTALDAGVDVLLERPPTPTVGQLEVLLERADRLGRVVFTAWHARYNPAVQRAAELLADKHVRTVKVTWAEDVRFWHPGQDWVWEPGGFGVFDPVINAFSLLSSILPVAVHVSAASLTFPEGRSTPVAAEIVFASADDDGSDMSLHADWLRTGEPEWDIHVETTDGVRLSLLQGGTALHVDDELVSAEHADEYRLIYENFASVLTSRTSGTDARPLQMVSDAFAIGRRVTGEPFAW